MGGGGMKAQGRVIAYQKYASTKLEVLSRVSRGRAGNLRFRRDRFRKVNS